MHGNNLKFNFGFLIDASPGTSNEFEFDYPQIVIEDDLFAPLTGKFSATRTGEGILVQGEFRTKADMECIRCLEAAHVDVFGVVEELFYYPPSGAPEFDSFTMGEDGNVDLGPLIRQESIINRPMQPLCKDDCNGLCIECGANLNTDPCKCEIDDIDPRLAALKSLIDKN